MVVEFMNFRPVPGYEGLYEVSDLGILRSLDRTVTTANGRQRRINGRTLIPKDNGCGYLFVTLCRDGKRETTYLHRLVAMAFLPNPEGKCCVNHKDGNPANNKLDNIEWATHAENVQHGYDTGLNKNIGGNHPFAAGVVDNMIGREFPTIKAWADERGINYATARNFLSGYTKIKGVDRTLIIKLNPQYKSKKTGNEKDRL